MDIEQLRRDLAARKGTWGSLAERARCSRKTIERLVNQPDYLPNIRTAQEIERALAETAEAKAA